MKTKRRICAGLTAALLTAGSAGVYPLSGTSLISAGAYSGGEIVAAIHKNDLELHNMKTTAPMEEYAYGTIYNPLMDDEPVIDTSALPE